MQLFYRHNGSGAPPIVILHGLFGISDNWLSVGKRLGEDFSTFLVDQRNHGQSPHVPEHDYRAMAADIKEFIEQQNLENIVLVGHSMGGKAAMFFAWLYPECLSKLMIVDIAPKYYPVHHMDIIRALYSVEPAKLKSRKEAETILEGDIEDWGTRQFLLKNLYWKKQEGKEDELAWRFNLDTITENIENIGETLPYDAVFTKPTMFVKGERSGYIRPEDMQLITRHFPAASLTEIAGAGHWVQSDQPEQFTSTLIDFIRS